MLPGQTPQTGVMRYADFSGQLLWPMIAAKPLRRMGEPEEGGAVVCCVLRSRRS